MIIETERTIIRYFKEDDYEDLYNYLSLDEIYEFEPGSPISMEDAKAAAKKRADKRNFIAVADKQTNLLIGHFSFFQAEPEYTRTYEIGFIFNPAYQGKGYASESLKAFTSYCFSNLNVHRLEAKCNPANQKSWKLLERSGFEREGELKKNIYFREKNGKPLWQNTCVYGLVNPEE